jgi:hypothetical protein
MNDAEMATKIAEMRKTNPAELIQKALNASMELQELLESIQKTQTETKAAIQALYKLTSEVKTLVVQTAECMEKHKDAHTSAPAV